MFVQGKWVDFGARTINQIYQLREDDSEEYWALFVETDFEILMQELTQGQGVWRRHPSTSEFTTFQMHVLTPLAKLCRSAGVPMLDSEEQVQQRLPIPLPSASDPMDGDPEVPSSSTQSLVDQIHALTTRLDAYWDESQEHRVALNQDMNSIRDEMATICAS